jgi:hypothetical protein
VSHLCSGPVSHLLGCWFLKGFSHETRLYRVSIDVKLCPQVPHLELGVCRGIALGLLPWAVLLSVSPVIQLLCDP